MSSGADPVPPLLEALRVELRAGRCTLRQVRPEAFFPITHEVLAPGAPTITDDDETDLRNQPVPRLLASGQRQVVQEDCRAASDEPAFHRMLERYGGMRAQVVTAIRDDAGELVAILSVHDLTAPRVWSSEQLARIDATAQRIGEVVP